MAGRWPGPARGEAAPAGRRPPRREDGEHPSIRQNTFYAESPGRTPAAADIQGRNVSLLPNSVMLVRIGTVDLGRMKVSNPADQPGRRGRGSSRSACRNSRTVSLQPRR